MIFQEYFCLEISQKLKTLQHVKNILLDVHLKGNRLIYLFNANFEI